MSMEGRRLRRTRRSYAAAWAATRTGHELRLLRGGHAAGGVEAEGGAGGLAGEGAEARAAEVAVATRCFGSFAHLSL